MPCIFIAGVGHRLSQHLDGELAGLMVLNNHTEADHVIQCINSCEQKLDFHAINEMETGMVSTDTHTDTARIHAAAIFCRIACRKRLLRSEA